MRRDFTAKDNFTNLNFVAHGLLFDMNGHTLRCEIKNEEVKLSSTYFACIKRAVNSCITFENGNIVVGDSPFITIGATSSKGAGYSINFTFRNVNFSLADGATTDVMTVKPISSTVSGRSEIIYENCSFDLGNASGSIAIFESGHEDGNLTTSVKVKGGKIITNGSSVSICRISTGGTLLFDRSTDGCYTVFDLPKGAAAPNELLNLEDGSPATFFKSGSESGRDTYTLLPESFKDFEVYSDADICSGLVYTLYVPVKNLASISVGGVNYSLSALKLTEWNGVECYTVPIHVMVTEAGVRLPVRILLNDGAESFTVNMAICLLDYFEKTVAENANEDLTLLCKDALAYIRSAYEYASDNPDERERVIAEINRILGDGYTTDTPTADEKAQSTAGLYSATLLLEENPSFIFCFDEGFDASDFTFSVDGVKVDCVRFTDAEGREYIKLTLPVYAAAERITYTARGGEISGEYNLRAYYEFALTQDMGLSELIRSLYKYSESAKAYMASINP